MDIWEYKILVSDTDDETDEEQLNTLGSEGWELVNAVADVRANEEAVVEEADESEWNVPVTAFYFKRKKST